MKKFWKRQLPALALALVMLAALAPAALADSVCPNSPNGHRAGSWEVSKEATCSEYGTEIQKCTLCGAPLNTRSISPTGVHNYQTASVKKAATCVSEGVENIKCIECGRTDTRTTPATGVHTPDANGQCTVCKAIVTSSSNSYTVSYHVGSGTYSTEQVLRGGRPAAVPSTPSLSSVPGDHQFMGWVSGSIAYPGYRNQSTVNPAGIAVNSAVTYTAVYRLRATGRNDTISVGTTSGEMVGDQIRSKVAAIFGSLTGESRFSTIYFSNISGSGKLYNNSRQDSLYNNYTYDQLSGYVYFIPSTAANLSVSYTAEDSYGNRVSGVLTFTGNPANSADILLRVAPGGTANLLVSRFEEAYRKLSNSSGTLRYVEFFPSTAYDSFSGSLYVGSRAFDRSLLRQWTFQVTTSSGSDYLLSDMSFRANSSARNGDELTIDFRVHDWTTFYDGTLRILIDKDAVQDGDIVYRVAPGSSVTFSRADFNQAYQALANTSRTISYVIFDPSDSYTHFTGKISAAGHADYTKDTLSREWFYYTGDRRDSYAIDDLIFHADAGARDGSYLDIPFWACYDQQDRVKGTLRILVDKNGSQDTVSLSVAPGGVVRLDKTAFNKVYQALSGYSNRTISAVSFNAPDTYRNFSGSLYVDNTSLLLSDLSYNATWFYYSGKADGKYPMDSLSFHADRSAREGESINIPFRAYYNGISSEYKEGSLRITITSEANTITYEAAPGGYVNFSADDFNRAYQTMSGRSDRTIRYVAFEAGSDYATFAGSLYAGSTQLTRSSLTYTQTQFYYGSNTNYGSYALSSLSFRPNANAVNQSALSIPFRVYFDNSSYEQGTLKLVVNTGGDISYTVTPGRTVNFDRVKFDEFFRKAYSTYGLDYVVFETPGTNEFPEAYGTLYSGYNTSYSYSFSRSGLQDVRFYYNASDAGARDYALNDLTFAAANSFTGGKVTLRFTAYGTNGRAVDGTLVITPTTIAAASNLQGSVRYAVTTGTNVQINANDLSRYYKSVYPSGNLQYVVLSDVPAIGGLYYNYYNASSYGTTVREQITASNRSRSFYMSPSTTSEYAMTELTYVPSGSNYCAAIPFTAYGTGGQTSGSILISVTNKAVSEVYGPTPKNTAVTFPASSIAAAVSAATGTTPSGIQLLSLPAANVGAIYVGTGTTPADTSTVYGYNTGSQQLGQLRFVPQTNYTGPVEIPYAALNASGTPIASGMFSMGVLNANKKFNDITAATWCYKYVTELADAAVIDGYSDGNFKPDSTITYGAALKLIMLAAGYSEQTPTVKGSTFSGYLSKAQADNLVTRSNVNLSGPITRLQVAQLAAGALKLDINNLSSVKPFTDTADVYVQALNAAGIVEGYFDNGTSTFRPSNTLTRGQVSAIVWRMQNYRK